MLYVEKISEQKVISNPTKKQLVLYVEDILEQKVISNPTKTQSGAMNVRKNGIVKATIWRIGAMNVV